jgi:isochorismate synthase
MQQKFPVAFYRMPRKKTVKVTAQKTKNESAKISKGFLFAPFQTNTEQKIIFIRNDIFCSEKQLKKIIAKQSISETALATAKKKSKPVTRTAFENHIELIQKKIAQSDFQKIVAARCVIKSTPKKFSAVAFFKKLCANYPDAFVSLVYSPSAGLWIGASPEVLLAVTQNSFRTNSLAGTKIYSSKNANPVWSEKEKTEQKIVSDFILKQFSKITNENPAVRGPKTLRAGNLVHLLTTYNYRSIKFSDWQKAVKLLHPTPAVAGLPKQKSIDFIFRNEKLNREYYSGYLGPVLPQKEVNLFVNLRCMQVTKNNLLLYVGCGITADSVPADEWKETEKKSETLLNLL